jgi:hypothetical protein
MELLNKPYIKVYKIWIDHSFFPFFSLSLNRPTTFFTPNNHAQQLSAYSKTLHKMKKLADNNSPHYDRYWKSGTVWNVQFQIFRSDSLNWTLIPTWKYCLIQEQNVFRHISMKMQTLLWIKFYDLYDSTGYIHSDLAHYVKCSLRDADQCL